MENKENVEMKHPYHFHPLILFEEKDVDGVFCFVCRQPISAPFYTCERCLFFLHKFCAELPDELFHFFHPEHSLQLRFESRKANKICEVCGVEVGQKFYYDCCPCQFTLDMNCASIVLKFQLVIKHAKHTHNLVPLEQSAVFLCNACNTEHRGNFFLCIQCGFRVDQECASSPTTVKLWVHNHPLTLLQSISESFYNHSLKCQICFEKVKRNQWVYFCPEPKCKYFVHMRCSTSNIEHSSDSKARTKAKELVDANLTELPWTNDSVDGLIAQLINNISSRAKKSTDNDVVSRQMVIRTPEHIHQHQLIPSENLQIDHHHGESSSSITRAKKKSEQKQCSGCGYAILRGMPFYYCAESKCNDDFYLHQWCARLPNEVEHPCHPQHKLRLITPQSPIHYTRYCSCCEIVCSTFWYSCVDCGFYMDLKCAGLPAGIRHEFHDKHVLTLRWGWGCKTCGSYLGYYSFVCEVCHLKVCLQCALLPGYVKHIYDKHPFTLTYSFPNVEDEDHHVQEYYCKICEEDIQSNRWFYHCRDCNQSLHVRCIIPNFK